MKKVLPLPVLAALADVTSCPGTDTCNLGISNSTGTAFVLCEVIEEEYPEFLYNKEISYKNQRLHEQLRPAWYGVYRFSWQFIKSKRPSATGLAGIDWWRCIRQW